MYIAKTASNNSNCSFTITFIMRNPEGNNVELVFCPQIVKELLLRDVAFDLGPQF